MGNSDGWLDAIALGLQEGLTKARTRNQSTVDALLPILAKMRPTNTQTRETFTPEAAGTHPGLAGVMLPESRTETTETPNPVFEQGMAAMQQANKGRLPFGISGAGGGRNLEELVRTIAAANQQQRGQAKDEQFADMEREYQLGQKYGLDKFSQSEPRPSPYESERQRLQARSEFPQQERQAQPARPTRRNVSLNDAMDMAMGEGGFVPSKSAPDTGYVNAQTGAEAAPADLQRAQQTAAQLVRSGITQEPLGGGGGAPVGGGEAGMTGGDPQFDFGDIQQKFNNAVAEIMQQIGRPLEYDEKKEIYDRLQNGMGG